MFACQLEGWMKLEDEPGGRKLCRSDKMEQARILETDARTERDQARQDDIFTSRNKRQRDKTEEGETGKFDNIMAFFFAGTTNPGRIQARVLL